MTHKLTEQEKLSVDTNATCFFFFFDITHHLVASWISNVSFMRWGFEGMLQVQFRGNMYPITIGNHTAYVDGIYVSSEGFKRLHVHLKMQSVATRHITPKMNECK